MTSYSRTSSTIEVLENDEGLKVTNDTNKASVQTKEDKLMGEVTNCTKFRFISTNTVLNEIQKLSFNNTCGPYGVRVNVLKRATAFSLPLHLIFNQPVYTSYIPQDWRDITPLHKKESRKKCNNYRPVSLTSQVVKLLEGLFFLSSHYPFERQFSYIM